MKLTLYRMSDDHLLKAVSVNGLPHEWPDNGSPHWLDIEQAHAEALEPILDSLGLHPLVFESYLDRKFSPHVDPYGNALYIEFPTSYIQDGDRPPYLSMVYMPSMLLTLHQEPLPPLERMARILSGDIQLHAVDTAMMVYHIFDHFIDRNILYAIRARARVDRLADALDDDPEAIEIEDIITVKRQMMRLGNIMEDQLYCVLSLQKIESPIFDIRKHREYFRDLVSDLENGSRFVERIEERLRELHNQYELTLQHKADSRLRVLTIISAIFLPLTLISSIYGMNFEVMPELGWQYGYFTVLSIMICIGLGMLWFFSRRGWFK